MNLGKLNALTETEHRIFQNNTVAGYLLKRCYVGLPYPVIKSAPDWKG